MSVLNKTQFAATYEDSVSGRFPTNTTQAIGSDDLRQFAEDIADSVPFTLDDAGTIKTVTEISSAEILAGNTTPIIVSETPAAGYCCVPIMFFVHFDYGGLAYATNTSLRFEINETTGTAVSATNTSILPSTADRYTTILPIAYDTIVDVIDGEPIVLKVQTGDPTAGNSIMFVTAIYSIAPLDV